MKKLGIIMVFIFVMGIFTMVNAEENSDKILYVSSNGSNSNSGTSEASPLKSIAWAYGMLGKSTKIVLLDNTEYYESTDVYSGDILIEGKTNSVKLTLPSTVNLKGNLKIDNDVLVGSKRVVAEGESVSATATAMIAAEGEHNYSAKAMIVADELQPILEAKEIEL